MITTPLRLIRLRDSVSLFPSCDCMRVRAYWIAHRECLLCMCCSALLLCLLCCLSVNRPPPPPPPTRTPRSRHQNEGDGGFTNPRGFSDAMTESKDSRSMLKQGGPLSIYDDDWHSGNITAADWPRAPSKLGTWRGWDGRVRVRGMVCSVCCCR
jgi:hypothetical protein